MSRWLWGSCSRRVVNSDRIPKVSEKARFDRYCYGTVIEGFEVRQMALGEEGIGP
jgi:hypothetical protein